MKRVAVIGGGAAGMLAAARCAERGFDVHLFEKNEKLGKKIYITGKGRCNITNAGDVEDFRENIPGNPYFMYSALYAFDSSQTVALFHSLGVKTKVERGNRIFPVSDRAADVVNALALYLKKSGVKIHLNHTIKKVKEHNGCISAVVLGNGQETAFDGVIIATGGLACPQTGSNGDGYEIAKKMGHTITSLYPSLVPLQIAQPWCAELMGLSLKNIAITIKYEKRVIYKDFGEMLFTHYGVSGPVILSASRHITQKKGPFMLLVDLKPAMDEKMLDNRLLRDFEKYSNKDFKNAMDDLLPQKMIPVFISLCEISPEKKVHSITKEERKKIVALLKGLPMTITKTIGFQEAVVTCGGICVDEINPSTMESKKIKNLYFAGELLDVDGYTGGYNLQIAFSTGYCAGEHILEE